MTNAKPPPTGVLEELRSLIEAEGGPLAGALGPVDGTQSLEVFGSLVAGGRRTSKDPRAYALLVESIFEGYLLHHARGRIVSTPDADLRLLAGDYLYAFGLERLAAIGDLEAVDELADLISICAQAHAVANATAEASAPWDLTGAVWASVVLAITGGSWPAHAQSKVAAREAEEQVIKKVLHVAKERANELGLELLLEQALIAFQQTVERNASTA